MKKTIAIQFKIGLVLGAVAIIAGLVNQCQAQNKTSHKASNGITYHVGDTISIATGSANDGGFAYIRHHDSIGFIDASLVGKGMNSSYSNIDVIIKKIKSYERNGRVKTTFNAGGKGMLSCIIDIEGAIEKKEIE